MSKETRVDRYKIFKEFLESSEEKFNFIKDSNKKYKKFDDYYSLNICPKGRNGRINERLFELFYGRRIFGSEKKMQSDFYVKEELLTEQGTTLSFEINDHGYVAIILHPSSTKYTKSLESNIFVENYLHPKKLLNDRFLKKQWIYFNSYMECTSIDGFPNWTDKIRIKYLRNFKNLVVDGNYQTKKASIFVNSILKYVLTVGLSGFLIYILTILPSDKNSKIELEKNSQLEEINNNLIENLKIQKSIIHSVKVSKDSIKTKK